MLPKIQQIFLILILVFLFSTFAHAQAVMSYVHLEVVDSNQKPIADATIETSSENNMVQADKKTDESGSAKFSSWNGLPNPTAFRIIKPDYYPFELFGLLRRVFSGYGSYDYQKLKVELLKIPKNKAEKKILGDEQKKRDFFLAVLNRNSAVVRRMLKAGINPNITTDDLRGVSAPKGIPAMLYAADNADFATMNEFLAAKVNLQKEDSNIRNLLAYYIGSLNNQASAKDSAAYFETLLKAGASLNATDNTGQSLLTIAALQKNVEAVKKLIEKGVNVNAKDNNDNTALTSFIYRNAYEPKSVDAQIEVIKTLLESGANPNIVKEGYNGDCEFPLKILARQGRLELVKLLLAYKTDPTIKCKNGKTALSELRSNKGDVNYPEVANVLIDAGLDVNGANEYGVTLMVAAGSGNLSVVKKLLDKGANVNAQGNNDHTPLMSLMYSLASGVLPDDKNIAELLLKSGANPNLVSKSEFTSDKTALAIAVCKTRMPIEKGQESATDKIIEVLISAKADPNITAEYGDPPLTCAAQNGRVETTKMLIKAGADVNYKNSYGQSALSAAKNYQRVYPNRTEYQEIIKLLEAAGAKE